MFYESQLMQILSISLKTYPGEEKMSINVELIKTGVIASSLVIIVGMFIYIMSDRQGGGSLTIKNGDNEVVMNFSDNKLNFSELINLLLNDDKYKSDTISILRDTYGLYKRNSILLVDQIRKEPKDSIFSGHIRSLLVDMRGPFERDIHSYYDIKSLPVVSAIHSLGYKHKVAIKLREDRDNAVGIFEQRGIDIDVAIYSSDKIRNGNAAVCQFSKYKGRDLLLLNPNDPTKTITVFSRNSFPCIKQSNGNGLKKPLVQLNPNDAKKLFGNIVFSSRQGAVLYPAQSGYSIEPKLVGIN